MKEKKITITSKNISSKQWSTLVLELNLMKQAWRSYGVDITLKAPGLKSILNHGTKVNDGSNNTKGRIVPFNPNDENNVGGNSIDK